MLADAAARGPHRAGVRLGGDLGGAAQAGELDIRFEEAHLVQGQTRVDQPHGSASPAALVRAHAAEHAQHAHVPILVASKSHVHVFDARQQFGQFRVELVDGERGLRAKSRLGAVDARASAGPDLILGAARAHEHHERGLGMIGAQQHHRPRLLKTGQIQDVAVLAEAVVHVAVANLFRRRRQQQRRARPEQGCQSGASFSVDGIHVGQSLSSKTERGFVGSRLLHDANREPERPLVGDAVGERFAHGRIQGRPGQYADVLHDA